MTMITKKLIPYLLILLLSFSFAFNLRQNETIKASEAEIQSLSTNLKASQKETANANKLYSSVLDLAAHRKTQVRWYLDYNTRVLGSLTSLARFHEHTGLKNTFLTVFFDAVRPDLVQYSEFLDSSVDKEKALEDNFSKALNESKNTSEIKQKIF
jgi:hypothetical protein